MLLTINDELQEESNIPFKNKAVPTRKGTSIQWLKTALNSIWLWAHVANEVFSMRSQFDQLATRAV